MTRLDFVVVAGSDLGKSKLDAHILDLSVDRQFKNDKPGRRALCNWMLRHGVNRTVLEPTGRHHGGLHQCLFGHDLFDRDSGQHHGGRCIRGGRARPFVSTRPRCPRFAGNAPPRPATNASSPRGKPSSRHRRCHAQARLPAQHPAPRGPPLAHRAPRP